ncbi:MAG: MazG family protein [Candidatus Dormiibacterota bacterium]
MTDDDLQQLRRLFEVMERLRAPGGCPWDRAQSHQTLLPFLLEETYETIQAAEEGSDEDLAEELGDLLVEVAMHSAIAAEAGTFDIGMVARIATEKMVSRHPHVFGDLEVDGVTAVMDNWEELKRREKPDRESALDGIPAALPALALASAIQRRQERGHLQSAETLDPAERALGALTRLVEDGGEDSPETLVADLLFSVVALARQRGVDPEGALRRAAAAHRQALRSTEIESRAGDGRRSSES